MVQLLLPPIVLVVLAVLVKFALLTSLPHGREMQYAADWRQYLGFFYPSPIYRPLILLPLWGRWGVLLAGTIGRVAPSSDSVRLRWMTQGTSLPMVMLHWAAISALTIVYCSPEGRHLGWSMLICLGVLLVTYLVSFVLARRFDGQTEATVTATGWAAEFAFLFIYLPIARAIYWF